MKVHKFEVGILKSNCYVVVDEETKHAVVIDPGEPNRKVFNLISRNNLKVEYILLTHGHFDHILGIRDLKELTNAKVAIHENDVECLKNSKACLYNSHFTNTRYVPIKPDILVNDGDTFEFGSLKITAKHTPGHTKGGVCYICEDRIFTGDTLFYRSIGKTTFPGGSMEELLHSLRKIDELDGEYVVYPGHGKFTLLNREREMNMYIREARNAFNN